MFPSLSPVGKLSCLKINSLIWLIPIAVMASGGCSSTIPTSPTKSTAAPPATPLIRILTDLLPTATTGAPYSTLLTATGGVSPYSWTITAGILPYGVGLDGTTGFLSGVATQSGDFKFQVKVIDPQGAAASASFSIRALNGVAPIPPPLGIQTQELASATVGIPYNASLKATGGFIPYFWSISTGILPGGFVLDSDAGTLSGTTNQSGIYTFQATVTDAHGVSAGESLAIQVFGDTTVSAVSSSPTCSAVLNEYFPVEQITCSNPNSGPTIMCVTLDGSAPSSNGLGTGCSGASWALSPRASGAKQYDGYFSINRSVTANVVAGVNGKADSAVVSYGVTVPTQAISAYNFGMQCGPGLPTNCPVDAGVVTWPTSPATPQFLRLQDSGSAWSIIEPTYAGPNVWTDLDAYLDALAAHPLEIGAYQFVSVPCFVAPSVPCGADSLYPNGTNAPPADLGTGPMGSSPRFNAFVTSLLGHTSAKGNSVVNNIKVFEGWNEWNLCHYWTGTPAQLYAMLAYPAQLIRAAIPGVIITTPSEQFEGKNCQISYATDLATWLNLENANGRISDFVDWHGYLSLTAETTNIPEVQWATYMANYLSAQSSISGWDTSPFLNSETNFTAGNGYVCPSSQYSEADCAGQVVRWQIMHDSNGGVGLNWYYFDTTIGQTPGNTTDGYFGFSTPYYYAQQYLIDGHFTVAASISSGAAWTAPMIEGNGIVALWVWTTDEAGGIYSVPPGYTDYRDLDGDLIAVTAGGSIAISTEPVMLEQLTAQ